MIMANDIDWIAVSRRHRPLPCLRFLLLVCSLVPPGSNVPLTASAAEAQRGVMNNALGDPLPPGAVLRLGSTRFRQPTVITSMTLSPDGKTVASIHDELIVWDAATGSERWRASMGQLRVDFPAASYGINALAFSPDGTRIYTPGPQHLVLSWDVETGRNQAFEVDARPRVGFGADDRFGAMVKFIDIARDGSKLAFAGATGLDVYDQAGKRLFEIVNKPQKLVDPKAMNSDRLTFGGHYSSGQFSPDGKILAVVTSDAPETVRLLDADTGNELRRLDLKAKLVRLAFSPNGDTIAATERDSAVRLYDVATGKRIWEHIVKLTNPYENYTSAIEFNPTGDTIAVAATDKLIRLLGARSGDQIAALAGHTWYPWCLAFAPDGAILYSAGWDGVIRRWDMKTHEQLGLPEGVQATGVAGISPNGQRIAYEDDSGRVRMIDVRSGKELRILALPATQYSQLVFSPDGRQLAGGGTSGDRVHIALWDPENGDLIQRWDWPKGRDPHSDVESLRFSPNGQYLAAAVFRQSMVYWWDVQTRKQVANQKHEEIYGLSISPDGKTLATVGWDSTLRLWDIHLGKLASETHIGEAGGAEDLRMYSVGYSPRGNILATQHMNGDVRLWDAATMKMQAKIPAGDNFGAMSFSPDGLWLATGTRGGVISLWDVLTNGKVTDIGEHRDSVDMLAFGPNSITLLSSGGDGLCYLWDLRPPALKRPMDFEVLWEDLADESPYAAYRAMCAMTIEPDHAATFIADKLRGVTKLMDPNEVDDGLSEEDAERRRRLKRLLIKKDPGIEYAVRVQRAVAILTNVDTPLAKKQLHELAKDPQSPVGRLATEELAFGTTSNGD